MVAIQNDYHESEMEIRGSGTKKHASIKLKR